MLRRFLGDGSRYGLELIFREQTERLGTAHAVMCCREQIEGLDGPVLILAGDRATMLGAPQSVVLTESAAARYFSQASGMENGEGKEVLVSNPHLPFTIFYSPSSAGVRSLHLTHS